MNTRQKKQYNEFWDKVSKEVAERNEVHSSNVKMLSYRTASMKGITARAIVEAHDGEVARKKKAEAIGRTIAAVYLMLTECMDLVNEVEFSMNSEYKSMYDFKGAVRKMETGFDEFHNIVKPLMSVSEMERFKDDLNCLDANVRDWANIQGSVKMVVNPEEKKKQQKQRIFNIHHDFIATLTDYKDEYGVYDYKELMEEIKERDKKD